ncbi:mCG147022 [Mus musculus]|nr:mCG147022 [Mus musculus]
MLPHPSACIGSCPVSGDGCVYYVQPLTCLPWVHMQFTRTVQPKCHNLGWLKSIDIHSFTVLKARRIKIKIGEGWLPSGGMLEHVLSSHPSPAF